MMKTSKIAIVIILAVLVATVAPVSAAIYAGGLNVSDRAEKFVNLADRAGARVQTLIDIVSLNTTPIEDAGLIDEYNGNVTFFETGLDNITNAYDCLAVEDYDGAIANATEALSIFGQVLKSIHYIMCQSDIVLCDIIDTPGLLVAIDRAQNRIDRLRELLPANATDAIALLDEAETYLDKDAAIQLLLDGNSTAVVDNLVSANQLIAQAYQYLKDQAIARSRWRINVYLELMARARERVRERFQNATQQGVNVNDVLNQMGYQNMTQFIQTLQNMAENARNADTVEGAIQQLSEIGQTIREFDQALTQAMYQHMEQHGQDGAGGNGPNGGSS